MAKIKISSYEAACKVLGVDPDVKPDVSMIPESEGRHLINCFKVLRIVRAFNTDQKNGKVWEPNWNDSSEWKYAMWLRPEASKYQPEGFAFSRSYHVSRDSDTVVGSRLCFKNRDDVFKMYEHFTPLLIDYFLITK